MKKFEEKTISTEHIFKGRIVELQVDEVRLPNGETSKRELINHIGAVAVIAVKENGNVLMVEQFRKPLEKSILEVPAGKLEIGEEPAITAVRELEEETGYTTEHLTLLSSFYSTPGFCNELIYLYFTDKLVPLKEKKNLDEDEFLELHELSLEELKHAITEERIHDIKTMYAVQHLELEQLKRQSERDKA